MPEIKVKIDTITHEKLKNFAKDDDRSLTKYITRGLEYLSNIPNGYHKTPITFLQNLSSSSSITLEQLKEAGVKDFKFNKSTDIDLTDTTINSDKVLLQQQKLDLEKEKVKKKRIEYLKEKAMEILHYLPSYLKYDRHDLIDFVLNEYPTNEDIIAYLNDLKQEDENAASYEPEIKKLEEHLSQPFTEEYQKIRHYCISHNRTYELYQLLLYPSVIQIGNYEHIIKVALGTPDSYNFEPEEIDLLLSYFTPHST